MSHEETKNNPINKIKNFFKKKKTDLKFKNAGEGQRLNENTRQPIFLPEKQYNVTPRQELSESAQKAAEAALIREYEKNSKPKPKFVDKSSIKKEIESEVNDLTVAYDLRDRAFGKPVEVDKPDQLQELKFCCPVLFDYDIIGNYNKVKLEIFKYLESELKVNPLEASCIIIHSKCSNSELLKSCLTTLETLVNNLLKSSNETKFRKIRLSNDKIRQNIVEVDGAIEFLKVIGFQSEEQPKSDNGDETETFLIISEEACIPEKLTECLEKLREAEPIKPVLYRSTTVYHKSNLANISESDLPSEFFRISLTELKKQNELRRQQIEESGMLMTKQMRENLKMRDKRKYRYVLIRAIFPNNWVLQGTFAANNTVNDIHDWLTDCLKVDEPFNLSVPPITKKLDNLDLTIVEADLAPCSILRVTFENAALNQVADKDLNLFLKEKLMI